MTYGAVFCVKWVFMHVTETEMVNLPHSVVPMQKEAGLPWSGLLTTHPF